jgi:hypothetical protein
MATTTGAPAGAAGAAPLATVLASVPAAPDDGGLADDPAALEQAEATIPSGIKMNIAARVRARLRG